MDLERAKLDALLPDSDKLSVVPEIMLCDIRTARDTVEQLVKEHGVSVIAAYIRDATNGERGIKKQAGMGLVMSV